MGVKKYKVYGKVKFGKEQQNTNICLEIEAFSYIDAEDKFEKLMKGNFDVNLVHTEKGE